MTIRKPHSRFHYFLVALIWVMLGVVAIALVVAIVGALLRAW